MKEITCWRVDTKGLDSNTFMGRFVSMKEAEIAGAKAGGYGPSIRREEIVIFDTAIEFSPDLNVEARESGLAKLTEEEREALGLPNA